MIEQHTRADRGQELSQADAKPQSSMLGVMRNRNFMKLWLAQILSQTAQQIINYALLLQVHGISNSSTAVSGIIIAFTVPAILFAAIAGVYVERNSKRAMLVITNVARGVMVLAYFLTDERWGAGAVLPIFYVVTFLFATVSQLFNPAEASMIPMVVKRHELVAANSLFNLTLTGTQLGGFVILGPLLLTTIFHNNYNGLYFFIFVLCIAAAAITYFLPKDRPGDVAGRLNGEMEPEKVGGGGSMERGATSALEVTRNGFRKAWDELAEGWHFIRRDPVIMNAILYWSIVIAVFMMLGTIGPGFLENVLGIDKDRLIYILLPGGLGLVVGVLIVGRVATPDNRESMINRSLLMASLALIFFALLDPILRWIYTLVGRNAPPAMLMLALLGGLTFLLGIFNSFISVPAQTALQERSPEEIRARVFSAFYTVANAILIVPVFFAGTMADILGYQLTVVIIGLAVLLVAAYGIYRTHRRNGEPGPPTGNTVTSEKSGEAAAEAALTSLTPATRPMPAETQQ